MLRTVTRLLTLLAILAGSAAWAGWVFLRTAADPSRAPRIASAILSDPLAKQEVASDLASSYSAALSATGESVQPALLKQAVLASLNDPSVSEALDQAITASEQSMMRGDKTPVALNLAPVSASVVAHLSQTDPGLAATIATVPSSDLHIKLPRVPAVASLRRLASGWVDTLAVGAAVCALIALLLGPRQGVLRQVGIWGLLAGGAWVILPWLSDLAARHFARSQAALVHAGISAATSQVTPVAAVLLVGGIAGITASLLTRR